MNIRIKKFIDYNNYEVFRKLTAWDNDKEI